MALSNIARVGNYGTVPIGPLFAEIVSLDFDNSYAANGEPLDTLLKAEIGASRTIVAVVQLSDAGGYQIFWDRTNAKLRVFRGNYDATGVGPLVEVTGTFNLSALTGVEFLVLSL